MNMNNDLPYDLEATPRSSLSSDYKGFPISEAKSSHSIHPITPPPPITPTAPPPSIRLLFSQLSHRDVIFLLLPAMLSSVIAGGIAPFMTYVVGSVFATFAAFPQSNPTPKDKSQLLHGVGLAALQLIGLAIGSVVLSSMTSFLWIWTGECNILALRKRVYEAVSKKEMAWFDTNMGAEADGPLGAGGLMAKFTRETDDVRTATSLASGQLLQYLTTCVACLFLAFLRSWSLTLVILSAVPLLMIIQTGSQILASPLLASERSATATAATIIDRAISSISTVKAFNAQAFELDTVARTLDRLSGTSFRLNAVWGGTSSLAQFSSMAMFVQGFWFGAKLVREGKVSAGDVMTVFWACLITASNLQMCIPQIITLSKGKFAMVSLLVVAGDAHGDFSPPPAYSEFGDMKTTTKMQLNVLPGGKRRPMALRKIHPSSCAGEFSFHNVTFTYPTLSTPTLVDVSLYLPAGEMTFIVGSSGSGKSTIAQLLLRLYAPMSGDICLDERDVKFLDDVWLRHCIVGVGQGWGDVVVEGNSVSENIRLGLHGVSEQKVEEACRATLLHDFVIGLPDGYDTILGASGGSGIALSGGQRQRLAIARAYLRDPPVLVLDEATSALDATSRLLVFEALKVWRKRKTTIVITHDLSQICPEDFVYVMKGGQVVERGFRCDLEKEDTVLDVVSYVDNEGGRGEFRQMLDVQLRMGGFLPVQDDAVPSSSTDVDLDVSTKLETRELLKAQPLLRPLTLGNWMFDVVADLTSPTPAFVWKSHTVEPITPDTQVPPFTTLDDMYKTPHKRRPSSLHIDIPPLPLPHPVVEREHNLRRLSLQFTPTSPVFSARSKLDTTLLRARELEHGRVTDEYLEGEKDAIGHGAVFSHSRRGAQTMRKDRHAVVDLTIDEFAHKLEDSSVSSIKEPPIAPPSLWGTIGIMYPTIPFKPLLFLGLFTCLLSGAMTPLFSFLLSRLLFEVSTGATNIRLINRYGGIVLGIAGLDGLFIGLKFFLMETSSVAWVTSMRKHTLSLILRQDKAWFDMPAHSPVRLVQVIVKDGDDARNLVAVVMGQCLVVVSMLGVGLVWAMVRGWQLTFVGLAIAPVFVGVMSLQTRLVAGCELKNKRAREEIAKGYYESIVNVRGIRAMGLERLFMEKFDKAANEALTTGVKGAFVEGCTYGVASGLIYFSEALLFYVGAILIAKGTYTYLQMVEVLNLVVFTVTIGSQLMAFTQKIAKSTQAAHDMNQLLKLSQITPSESGGSLRPVVNGAISLNHVRFSYPERPNAPVLKDINLTIAAGECIAIVGPSGSGKSTIAALLQRLYEPSSGTISVDGTRLSDIDVHHLRHHVSIVSQNPNLFDASISENIRYGSSDVSEVDVRRAAKQANVHEFVMSLPKGYDTPIGENGGLISGGQAQRLQIARALARPANILILDECTSALDPENQMVVLESIARVMRDDKTAGRTTVMVTHKLQVMQMCDRIVVVDGGEVKEEGTFDELIRRKGVFATLAGSGEWVGE